MYKVFPVSGGWSVFWLKTPDAEPVPVPKAVLLPEDEIAKWEPYKQRSAAYRRCKKLNDAIKHIDSLVAKDGAIIL